MPESLAVDRRGDLQLRALQGPGFESLYTSTRASALGTVKVNVRLQLRAVTVNTRRMLPISRRSSHFGPLRLPTYHAIHLQSLGQSHIHITTMHASLIMAGARYMPSTMRLRLSPACTYK
jgi:hypothetical protein